jgi:hypothetical protein
MRCVVLVVAGNERRRLHSEMESLPSVIASIADHEGPDSDRAQDLLQLEAAAPGQRVAAAFGARYSFSFECMPERMRADIQGNCGREE